MRKINLTTLSAAAATALFAGALLGTGAAIAASAPSEGTVGTSLVIDLADAGTKAPKVLLVTVGAKKKYTLQVTAFDATTVTALVTNGKPGSYDVVVDTKDGTDETFPAAFQIFAPDVQAVVPAIGNPNQVVTVTGTFLGQLPPKVTLGKKRLKLTNFDDNSASFAVPTSLRNGTYDLVFKNKAGTDSLSSAFTVRNSLVGAKPIKGSASLTATVNGTSYVSGGRDIPPVDAVAVRFREGPLTVSVNTRASVMSGAIILQHELSFECAADLNAGPFPLTVSATAASYNRTDIGAGMPTGGIYDLAQSGGNVSVTFTRYVGGRVQGTVTGSINRTGGTGPTTAEIVGGSFIGDVSVEPAPPE